MGIQTNEMLVEKVLSCLGLSVNKGESQDFRERIMDVVKGGKMVIPKRDLLKWAFLVHDYNRIHIFKEYAKEAGFEATPVHGTLIVAHAEQYALDYLNEINDFVDRNLVYSGHGIKFKRPLYPNSMNAKANWSLDDVAGDGEGIDLNFSAFDSKVQTIVSCPKVSFRAKRKNLSEEDVFSFLSSNNTIGRNGMEIKKGELETFYRCLGKEPRDEVPMMYASAFIPAVLLELASRRTGEPEGTYVSMDLEFYNPPNLGILDTTIKMSKPPRKMNMGGGKEAYRYRFEALCVQNNAPILGGNVVCYSPNEFKI